MNKTAIAFLTRDKTELSRRTVEPLLNQPFDLHWVDGSATDEGKNLPTELCDVPGRHLGGFYRDVLGGPDAAVAYALTQLLADPRQYDFIGLCENDVLLEPGWFHRTMELFTILDFDVGAVSARAYEDRVLIQRDGYAVMHNTGWGQVIFTREAAQLTLRHFRTHFTAENRRLFCHLTGLDIGEFWAFRASEHFITADWGNDRVLAAHGLASLALTPSPVEMIGQTPPLAEQGLAIAQGPVEARRDDVAFAGYVRTTRQIRAGELRVPNCIPYRDDQTTTYMPHQLGLLEQHSRSLGWQHRWAQGFGPFAWEAGDAFSSLDVMVSGPCEFLVSGGKAGGQVRIEDIKSGYCVSPTLMADASGGQMMSLVCPAGVSRREVRLTCLAPGLVFHGLRCREPQPESAWGGFDHSVLPGI